MLKLKYIQNAVWKTRGNISFPWEYWEGLQEWVMFALFSAKFPSGRN